MQAYFCERIRLIFACKFTYKYWKKNFFTRNGTTVNGESLLGFYTQTYYITTTYVSRPVLYSPNSLLHGTDQTII